MTGEAAFAIVACACYWVAAFVAAGELVLPARRTERVVGAGALAGALCLTAALVLRGFRTGRFPAFGTFEVLALYAVATTLAYGHIAVRHQSRGMSSIMLPYIAILVLCALFGIGHEAAFPGRIQPAWLAVHVVTAFIGYGLFTLESCLGVAYLIQDRNLKRKNFGRVFDRLPSLEILDRLMYEHVGVAFLVFSLSIVSGIVLTHLNSWGSRWTSDPKVAGTAATWLVYAALFHLRMSADRHGRKVALLAVFGFMFVLFSFLGVHLIAGSMHDFIFATAGPRW